LAQQIAVLCKTTIAVAGGNGTMAKNAGYCDSGRCLVELGKRKEKWDGRKKVK
jgi:hypothetical protein